MEKTLGQVRRERHGESKRSVEVEECFITPPSCQTPGALRRPR